MAGSNIFFSELNALCEKDQKRNAKVDYELLERSQYIISNTAIRNIQDAFLFFSALNYLNACIKVDKACASYSFKSDIQRGVNTIKYNNIDGISMFYERHEHLFLINFYDFIFSYHCPGLDDETINYLSNQREIVFDGIRKQCVADLILRAALKRSTGLSLESDRYNANNSQKDFKGNIKPNCSFLYNKYQIEDIIQEFHLHDLTTNKVSAHNIAIVIAEIYFYYDLIKNSVPILDDMLKKALYREIIIQSYSICETLECELGYKYLGLEYSSSLTEDDQNKAKAACRCHVIKMKEGGASKFYDEFKKQRHNVHLCKNQNIENDPYYNQEHVDYVFLFTRKYIQLMYDEGLPNIARRR